MTYALGAARAKRACDRLMLPVPQVVDGVSIDRASIVVAALQPDPTTHLG